MNQSVVSEKLQDLYKVATKSKKRLQTIESTGGRSRRDPATTRLIQSLTKDVNDRVQRTSKRDQGERDKLDDHEKNIDVL